MNLQQTPVSPHFPPILPQFPQIPDPQMERLVRHMLQVDPQVRCTAKVYREKWTPLLFPHCFGEVLHPFLGEILPLDSVTRVPYFPPNHPPSTSGSTHWSTCTFPPDSPHSQQDPRNSRAVGGLSSQSEAATWKISRAGGDHHSDSWQGGRKWGEGGEGHPGQAHEVGVPQG